jgi:uncharacterized membrane protein YkoI
MDGVGSQPSKAGITPKTSSSPPPSQVLDSSLNSSITITPPTTDIDADKARRIARAKVGGGTVTEVELEEDKGRPRHYDITIIQGTVETEVEVNAATGEILSIQSERIDDDDLPLGSGHDDTDENQWPRGDHD